MVPLGSEHRTTTVLLQSSRYSTLSEPSDRCPYGIQPQPFTSVRILGRIRNGRSYPYRLPDRSRVALSDLRSRLNRQTARPRHTSARPDPNPQLKEKLSEYPSAGVPTLNPSSAPGSHALADQEPQRQVFCEALGSRTCSFGSTARHLARADARLYTRQPPSDSPS
jgi:hypothetical protein